MKLKLKSLVIAAAAVMTCATAIAQEYPNKPIKILVGYAPGGAPDVIARAIGQRMSVMFKQQVIIENKPGAGGTLATAQAAKAPADGYTLLSADVGQIAIAPFLFKGLPYDSLRDFAPISMVAGVPLVLATNAKTNIKTVADLIREAKANPGKLSYASSGIGSIHHIAMEMFKREAGIDVTHIPYKGSAQSVPALLGGEVQVAMTSFPTLGPFAPTGQVNLIAVTSPKRLPNAPDAPPLAEMYKGFDYAAEIGFMAPAGTPPDIIAKLDSAIKAALGDAEIQSKLNSLGAIPNYLNPAEYTENVRQNLKKYKVAVEVSNASQN
jgi:tripartite-type tricarboxylate transporter receptor subunit TctC